MIMTMTSQTKYSDLIAIMVNTYGSLFTLLIVNIVMTKEFACGRPLLSWWVAVCEDERSLYSHKRTGRDDRWRRQIPRGSVQPAMN